MNRKNSSRMLTATSMIAAACVVGAICLPTAFGATGTNAKDSIQWPTYGENYANTRFVNLTLIDDQNVKTLTPVWMFQTGEVGSDEGSPIVVGNTMYVTTGDNDTIIALNATTGKMLWRHRTTLGFASYCCGSDNRGVAVASGKVFYATLDGRLIALNAKTGAQLWATKVGDPKRGFSETMAPLAWNGMVFIGSSGGEYGIRGSFTAYSQKNGKELWRWWATSPGWEGKYVTSVHGVSLHRDTEKEKAEAPKYKGAWKHGGGPIWMTPALDPTTHTIFLSTGNPAPQLIGSVRPGDNLYTDSIVALNANTGKMKWYYQETPHDLWDYDATSPPLLFPSVNKSGQPVNAVGEAGKTGWFYILDRKNGKLLRVSEPFIPQKNIYEPPGKKGLEVEPGALGGSNWSPVSYNPDLGLAYIAAVVQPRFDKPKSYVPWKSGGERWAGSRETPIPGHSGYGTFSAINVKTGKIAWQDKTGMPLIGGSLAVPGLTFVGQGNGMLDAMDAKTGKILWQFQTGSGISAPPIAYEIDGREYVAVESGGNALLGTEPGDAVEVFAVPK